MSRTDEAPDIGPAKLALLGEWLRRKNRGRSESLLAVDSSPVTVIECLGDDQLAMGCMVACAMRAQGAAAATELPAVRGNLRWGVDGHQSEAEFDFTHGTVLHVAGAFVQITAAIDRDSPDNGDPMPGIVVGAHISYLPPSVPPVYRTRYFVFGAQGGSATLSIPPFARSVRVQKSVDATVLTVQQRTRTATVTAEQISAQPIEQQLANDTRALVVSAASALVGRAVFSLWL